MQNYNSKLKIIFLTIFFFGLFGLAKGSQAADFYIAQSAAGSDTGADCANAHAVTWFNTSGNWANPKVSGKIGPGDTAHLCGTITSALTIQASGSSGNPITVLFETNAIMTSPAWPVTGAIIISGKNYITIDGGSNGTIADTDNGLGLTYQLDSRAIVLNTASNIIIKNLTFNNLFIRQVGTDQLEYGTGVYGTGGQFSNIRVTNCSGHDMARLVFMVYGGSSSNFEFDHLTAYNINWGVGAGDYPAGSTLTNISVHDCHFYNFSNWDDTSINNMHHHNGAYVWSSLSGSMATGIRYYNNLIGPGFGIHATSGVFIQYHVYDAIAYNNIFVADAGGHPSNGFIFFNPGLVDSSTYGIYNNTFTIVGGTTGIGLSFDGITYSGSGATTVNIKNNIIQNATYAISIMNNTAVTLISDYNDFYPSDTILSTSAGSSASAKTVTQWKALGYDIHSSWSNPSLNGDYTATASTPVGTSLSSYFTTDYAGYTRSPWNMGAYEYASGSSDTTPPAAPQGLAVQ